MEYYFPRAETKIVVTQTVTCTPDNKRVVTALGTVATPIYFSDRRDSETETPKGTIQYNRFGGTLKDADIGPTFSTDGRLTGFNATTTGEGAAVVKSAVALATAAVVLAQDGGRSEKQLSDTCAEITSLANGTEEPAAKPLKRPKAKAQKPAPKASKPGVITLTYSVDILYPGDGTKKFCVNPNDNPNNYATDCSDTLTLKPDMAEATIYSKLSAINKQQIQLLVVDTKPNAHPVYNPHVNDGYTTIELNATNTYHLQVKGPDTDFGNQVALWDGNISVPSQAHYALAVPTGAVFGMQGFALTLSDAGDITKLEYSNNTGTSGALDAATAIVGALPNTASTADQTQANLIYQEQRLAICKATPAQCPSS